MFSIDLWNGWKSEGGEGGGGINSIPLNRTSHPALNRNPRRFSSWIRLEFGWGNWMLSEAWNGCVNRLHELKPRTEREERGGPLSSSFSPLSRSFAAFSFSLRYLFHKIYIYLSSFPLFFSSFKGFRPETTLFSNTMLQTVQQAHNRIYTTFSLSLSLLFFIIHRRY